MFKFLCLYIFEIQQTIKYILSKTSYTLKIKVEFSVFPYFFDSIILKSFGNFYLINLTTKFSYLPEFIFQMDNCSIFTV